MTTAVWSESKGVLSESLSRDVIEWSGRAGFAHAVIEDCGGLMFWTDPHGETCIYLRPHDGWITVTSADRSADESYVLAAPNPRAIECYLFDYFGSIIRDAAQLPVLEFPMGRVSNGFEKVAGPPGFIELTRNGQVVVRSHRGLLGSMHLAVISHLLDAAVVDIEASYLSDSGLPLFGRRTVRPS